MSAQSARGWLLGVAQEVEENPERWTKGFAARDSNGKPVGPDDKSATCWCALGLMNRDLNCGYNDALNAVAAACDHKAVSVYNDNLASAADFVAWFRRAAELCT